MQQVIREETNVTAVSDPLAGSYYVESLTNQMADAALALVERIEAQGGYIAAQQSGWIRSEVEASASRWRERINSGDRRVVGLNCYETDEAPLENVFRVDPEVERIAVERIQTLRASRDSARHAKAMQAFQEASDAFAGLDVAEIGDAKLMHAAIAAAQADATTGEMMGVLKRSLGWGAPHEF